MTTESIHKTGPRPLELVLERLFNEAPKLTDAKGQAVDGQAPALECAIMLTSGATMQGVLSRTPEGTLRMMSPIEVKDPRSGRPKSAFAEQFFMIDDVITIALQRDIAADASRIISS